MTGPPFGVTGARHGSTGAENVPKAPARQGALGGASWQMRLPFSLESMPIWPSSGCHPDDQVHTTGGELMSHAGRGSSGTRRDGSARIPDGGGGSAELRRLRRAEREEGSARRRAAVDGQHLARDEVSERRGEEQGRVGDVLGLADAPPRDGARQGRHVLGSE